MGQFRNVTSGLDNCNSLLIALVDTSGGRCQLFPLGGPQEWANLDTACVTSFREAVCKTLATGLA